VTGSMGRWASQCFQGYISPMVIAQELFASGASSNLALAPFGGSFRIQELEFHSGT